MILGWTGLIGFAANNFYYYPFGYHIKSSEYIVVFVYYFSIGSFGFAFNIFSHFAYKVKSIELNSLYSS